MGGQKYSTCVCYKSGFASIESHPKTSTQHVARTIAVSAPPIPSASRSRTASSWCRPTSCRTPTPPTAGSASSTPAPTSAMRRLGQGLPDPARHGRFRHQGHQLPEQRRRRRGRVQQRGWPRGGHAGHHRDDHSVGRRVRHRRRGDEGPAGPERNRGLRQVSKGASAPFLLHSPRRTNRRSRRGIHLYIGLPRSFKTYRCLSLQPAYAPAYTSLRESSSVICLIVQQPWQPPRLHLSCPRPTC